MIRIFKRKIMKHNAYCTDTLLWDITSGDELSVDAGSSPFLKVVDGKLYTARDITLDGSENQVMILINTSAF